MLQRTETYLQFGHVKVQTRRSNNEAAPCERTSDKWESRMTVGAILAQKGQSIVSVSPEASIAEVTHVLAEHRIGAVLVCNERGDLMGILSERDIVAALASDGASVLDQTADHMMTRHVTTAIARTTVGEAMQMMTNGRFRHLPVLDLGRVIGVISIGDVVKARMSQQEQEVDSLKAYVSGAA